MKLRFPERLIREFAERYSYQRAAQALLAFRPEVQHVGHLTVDQLKQVALWKAPRVAGHVDKNDPEFVREVTGWALNARSERARIETLTLLDGVQWPTASVILHLFHSDPYPILDFRALWSVGLDVPDQYSFSFWWPYVEFCRAVALRNGVDMRTLDHALWQYSKESQRAEGSAEVPETKQSQEPKLDRETGSGTLAERIRTYTYDRIIRPAFDAGRAEVVVRAGDVHSAMCLASRLPAVCAALESRKFAGRYGLVLVRREGPSRGSNVFFHFRPAGPSEPGRVPERRRPSESAALPDRTIHDQPHLSDATYWISCVSGKRFRPAPAKDLYTSDWFSKARRFVESKGAPWFVLSAKYGLVGPEEVIEPYELTLNTMGVADRRRWANRVLAQLPQKATVPKRIVMLAGMRYREFLEPRLRALGIDVHVPMEGLRIGEQLSWLDARSR